MYLLQSESPPIQVHQTGSGAKLLRGLLALEEASSGDAEPVRSLALALLNGYQCDWDYEEYLAAARRINKSRELVGANVLEKMKVD